MNKDPYESRKKVKIGSVIGEFRILEAYVDKTPSGCYRHRSLCRCGKEFLAVASSLRAGMGCGCRRWSKLRKPSSKREPPILDGDKFGSFEVVLPYVMKSKSGMSFHGAVCVTCGSRKVLIRTSLTKKGDCKCNKAHPNRKNNIKIGDIFGKWTVIDVYSHRRKGRGYTHTCRCECGQEKQVAGVNLLSLGSRQCVNCRGKEKTKRTPQEHLFYRTKRSAVARGIEVQISLGEFSEIIINDCFYCGASPVIRSVTVSGPIPFKSNGVDRVNNDIGYLKGNCVPCCTDCNSMKMSRTLDEFLLSVERIYEKHIEGNK
jgi:hypothetical protein